MQAEGKGANTGKGGRWGLENSDGGRGCPPSAPIRGETFGLLSQQKQQIQSLSQPAACTLTPRQNYIVLCESLSSGARCHQPGGAELLPWPVSGAGFWRDSLKLPHSLCHKRLFMLLVFYRSEWLSQGPEHRADRELPWSRGPDGWWVANPWCFACPPYFTWKFLRSMEPQVRGFKTVANGLTDLCPVNSVLKLCHTNGGQWTRDSGSEKPLLSPIRGPRYLCFSESRGFQIWLYIILSGELGFLGYVLLLLFYNFLFRNTLKLTEEFQE